MLTVFVIVDDDFPPGMLLALQLTQSAFEIPGNVRLNLQLSRGVSERCQFP